MTSFLLSPYGPRKGEGPSLRYSGSDPTQDPDNAASYTGSGPNNTHNTDGTVDPSPDDTSTGEASTVGVSDLSGLPYLFNPPIHPSLLHVQPGMGKAVYGTETASNYLATTDFSKMRLGRMCMGKESMSWASIELGTRFGFRFLYNPSTVKGGTFINGDFIVNPSSPQSSVIQDGLESISFELMINRMPELQGNAQPADFFPPITRDDMDMIYKYGTHWDLEFLYRCANGLHQTQSDSLKTGNIGILLPNPLRFYLGPFLTTGQLEQIQAEDIMFTSKMIPMLTNVSIVYRRNLQQVGTSIAMFKQDPTTTASSSSSGGSSSGSTPSGGSGWTLAPSLKKLGDDAKAKYSDVSSIGTYRIETGSGHNPVGVGGGSESKGTMGSVHAIDIMTNVTTQSMDLLNKLVAKSKAGDTRLWYLIHDRKIWSKNHGWAARTYTGHGTAHTDHIHVSLNGDTEAIGVKNENDTSGWGL